MASLPTDLGQFGAPAEAPSLFVVSEPTELTEVGLPTFDIGIEERIKGKVEHPIGNFGTFRDDVFIISDGARRTARIFRPFTPRYSIGAEMSLPLDTGLGGINTTLGKEAVDHGLHLVEYGPDEDSFVGSVIRLGKTVINRNSDGRTSLARDAYEQHLIRDEIDRDSRTEAGQSVQLGFSKGIMTAFGYVAYAGTFGREVLYTDGIDPCAAEPIKLRQIDHKKLPGYFLGELTEIRKGITDCPAEEARHVFKTLPGRPSAWVQQGSAFIDIKRGATGRLASRVPKDSLITVTAYTESMFNDLEVWIEKLPTDEYPRVEINPAEGRHGTGVKRIVRREALGRTVTFLELVKGGADPATILPADLLDLAA